MTPTYSIKREGEDITALWRPYLVSISVTDRSEDKKADSCTIVLQDTREELELPEPGVQLEISLGYDGNDLPESQRLHSVGKFLVDTIGVSGPPNTVSIESKSAAFTENGLNLANIKTRKSRTHETQTVGSLVGKVAGEHGLESEVDPELAGVNLGTVQQTDETDSHMLSRIADSIGATYKIADNRMLFVKPGNSASGQAAQFTISGDSITSWSFKRSKRPEYKSCVAFVHDVGECGPVEVTAGEGEPVMRLRNPYDNEEAALTAARAFVNESRKKGGAFAIRMPGRSDLFAGARAILTNLPYDLSGYWELTEVQHTLNKSGFSTEAAGKPL